jgi:hypothetical protein
MNELKIQQRRDALQLEAQRISLQIYELEKRLNKIPEGLNNEYLRKPLIREKEGLHTLLGITNSKWSECLWILDNTNGI